MTYQQTIFGEEQALNDRPSSAEDFPASRFPWLESKKAKGTTVISGRKCSELSESLRRVGSSVRTYLESCALPLTTFVRTWSVLATKSGYSILKLRLSERCTGGSESRLWRTPGAADVDGRSTYATFEAYKTGRIDKGKQISLANQIKFPQLWATPNTMDHLPARSPDAMAHMLETARKGRSGPSNLREQVDPTLSKLWPTPKAGKTTSDGEQERTATGRRIDGNGRSWSPSLADAVKLWPTPTRREFKGARTPEALKAAGRTPNNTLGDAVMASDGGQLNPTWVEWLMGFPLGWTDLNASEMP